MITNLHIKNFFSFKDCSIDLHPKVNILVGINGSGKSNLLKVVDIIRTIPNQDITDYLYKEYGGDLVKHISSKENKSKLVLSVSELILRKPIEFNYSIILEINTRNSFISSEVISDKTSSDEVVYKSGDNFRILEKKKIIEEYEELSLLSEYDYLLRNSTPFRYVSSLVKLVNKISVYRNFDSSKNGELRLPYPHSKKSNLEENGNNLPQVLEKLRIENKEVFKLVLEQLNRINPNYINIDFKSHPNFLELWLDEKGFNKSIHVSQVSDGTLKFLCLMAIFYNPNRGSVICIDEPETGLHPDMLIAVADGIKYASETSQMIISTHSPLLLNRFELENIRVFEKDEENATIVKQLDREEYESWSDDYTLGELWTSGHLEPAKVEVYFKSKSSSPVKQRKCPNP